MLQRLGLGLLLLLANLSNVFGQDVAWRSGWFASGHPYLLSDSQTAVRTTTGQFVVVVNRELGDYEVISMTSGGAINWQTSIADLLEETPNVIAGADGSVYVGTPGATTKIDAAGHVVWYRNDLGDSHLVLTADALYLGSCNDLSSLDIDTGITRWSIRRGNAHACGSDLGVDPAGNVYLVSQVADPPYVPVPPVRLAKFDASGSLLWDISATVSGSGAGFLGVSDGHVYINQGFDVGAYDASTGASTWTQTQQQGWVVAGSPASPLATDNFGLHKLDAADGHTDWTLASFSSVKLGLAQGNDAYFCVLDNVQKIDATSGVSDWSYSINDLLEPCFALILDATSVIAASADVATGSVRLDTIDAGSGTAQATALAADTQQGLGIYNALADQGQLIQLGRSDITSDDHLRSIDAATGTVSWDVAFRPQFPGFGPAMALSADSIIVTDYTGYSGFALYGPSAGYYWVASFARSDGSQRWSQYEYQTGQSDTWGSAPVTDSHGDIFVSYFYTSSSCIGGSCPASSLLKLSAADGSVLWRFDFASFYETAPAFALIGDDVVVLGSFTGAQSNDHVVRLSGSDGSVMWSAAPFGNTLADTVAVNPDGTVTVVATSSRALLQGSGAVLWVDTPAPLCPTNCPTFGQAELADGTTIYAGTDYVSGYSNSGWIVAQPLAQNATVRKVFVEADAPADVRKWARQVIVDGDAVWVAGTLRQLPHTEFSFLGKLDPGTLAVSDQQILTVTDADAFAPGLTFDMAAAPANNALLADTFVNGDGASVTGGAALFDTSIAARGDLAIGLTSADSAGVSTFRASATYDGDAPVAGVRMALWHGGYYDADALQCATSNASNCVIANHSGHVEVTFDMQPGGNVTVTGSYPTSPLTLYASVYGPGSLAEPTLGNNFVSFPVSNDELFRNGFE